jgi:hypothetical protein
MELKKLLLCSQKRVCDSTIQSTYVTYVWDAFECYDLRSLDRYSG